MKPADKIIIYDDACPMCSAYTKAFVRTGFIAPEGRRSFSAISTELLEKIDNRTCRNEIPLIDTSTNTVKYGIDALLDILGYKLVVIKIIGNFKPVNWFLKKLYNLISYNRRVITAGKQGGGDFDCTPDFNIKYRLLFLCIGLCFNTLMLIPEYHFIIVKSFLGNCSLLQLQAAHLVFVLANILLSITLHDKKGVEFLGQANVLALLTTLLLLPLYILNHAMPVNELLTDAYLFCLLVFIIKEYKRRMEFAGMTGLKYVLIINIISVISFLIYLAF